MILETFDLTKTYRGQGGCREVCLSLDAGQAFGLLGPNGAGKSTLVKTLLGLLLPESGGAHLLGKSLGDVAIRGKIGYLPENFRYHSWLSGQELVDVHGRLSGLRGGQLKQNVARAMALVGMEQHRQRKVGSYSKGMQQRIGLACALVNRPALVFLDEPTSALDPLGRRDVRVLIQQLKQEGVSVFLNSHLLGEVESVCDRVAVMIRGRIVETGSPDQLLLPTRRVRFQAEGLSDALAAQLAKRFGPVTALGGNVYECELAEAQVQTPLLVEALVGGGARVFGLQMHRETLEDAFIRLVERSFGGGSC
jgi:ABC-2 type transport system ATP-binding protein